MPNERPHLAPQDEIAGTSPRHPRLQNSVPQRGIRPSILVGNEGRLRLVAGGPPWPSDGPALAGHCWPDLLYELRRSVGRVPPCSGSSRLQKVLSQCGRHAVEGQVWASCSCAHHSHRSPAHSTALSRAIIGASQMSVDVAGIDDLDMPLTAKGTR